MARVEENWVHFVQVSTCECLCAASFKNPSTVFTFMVLDDFLRDNLECGTSGMNYYSKLHRVTSGMFPHLVPNRYCELLHVAWQWCMLKLLKWNGFKKDMGLLPKGDLALFCMTCPQPGINIDPKADLDKQVDNSHFLHIPLSLQIVPGIGMWHIHGHKQECYMRYAPLFIKGSGWVDGEIIKTLWSILNIVFALTCGMTSPHWQELLDFQMNDSNFMKMIRMGD
ncbi:hypothetical protein EDC04DRAFT_2873515 [Pisolithus marmoratus]|nr:hypothetical protein EDC04DRAFT_2873515 [Pisolithus marmoratus]